MTNKFMEANRKRFEQMKKPLIKKKAIIAAKARAFVEDSKAQIAVIDAQLEAITTAENALLTQLETEQPSQPEQTNLPTQEAEAVEVQEPTTAEVPPQEEVLEPEVEIIEQSAPTENELADWSTPFDNEPVFNS